MNKFKFVRIPADIHKAIKKLAKKDNYSNLFKRNITIQDEVAILLTEAIEKRKEGLKDVPRKTK